MCLFFCGSNFVMAQEFIVFGQILSDVDREPLEAVNVWFKGTTNGTTTTKDGYFILRSNEPQKTMVVSIVGYKRREIKLNKTSDQILEIFLKEENSVLEELIVIPGENEAFPILRQVQIHRDVNNPDKMVDFSTQEDHETKLFFTNIKTRSFQRKLFRELVQGTLLARDSMLLMPVFFERRKEDVTISAQGEESRKIIQIDDKTLRFLPEQQVGQLLSNFTPTINFYKNYITILQSNFISPLANQGTLYYHYFLMDSTQISGSKNYHIRFRPKNDKELAFKGDLWIDSVSWALTAIKASMPITANINYLHSLLIEQTYSKTQSDRFYPQKSFFAMSFQFNIDASKDDAFAAVFEKTTLVEKTHFNGDSVVRPSLLSIPDSVSDPEMRFKNAIDSLNKTKIQRLAFSLVDLFMNGYIHVWKFDIGPIVNMIRYNQLEGFRPTVALRTGQKMMDNVTVGGYVGYGFGDKKWKYGAELRARFGDNHAHTLNLLYDNDVIRYGYNNILLVNENMVGSTENLLTTFSRVVMYKNLAQQYKASLSYVYEQTGLRVTASMDAKELLSNDGTTFVQYNQPVNSVKTLSTSLGIRLSFKENSLDNYFHRYYLRTIYPIINVYGEYGMYDVGQEVEQYGKVLLMVKQSVPLFSGKLKYMVEGGYIFGNVPFTLLNVPRGTRGLWFPEYDFCLMNQMEFMNDAYVAGNFRYITSGWIFNYIPWVKKANLREELLFKIVYGGLREGHSSVLQLPQGVSSLEMPYMEAGFGICNILKLFSVQSVWRLTHRHDEGAINWGISCRFNIDF